MILTIDIGNTNIHIGLHHQEKMFLNNKYATKYGIDKRFFSNLCRTKNIEGIGIASVVPTLGKKMTRYFKKDFGIKPLVVCSALKMPVKIAYKNLGADRIANIVGGFIRYHSNLIILSFGTAITCDVILKDATHLGGIILPGLETQLWSLKQRTALLKNIQLESSNSILLGKNTNECIRSGIINGTKFGIQGFIQRIKKTTGKHYKIIATGGDAKKLSGIIPEIDIYDQDLIHYGILNLYYYNA